MHTLSAEEDSGLVHFWEDCGTFLLRMGVWSALDVCESFSERLGGLVPCDIKFIELY